MKRRGGNEYPKDPEFYVFNFHEYKQFQRTLLLGMIGSAAVESGEPGILSPDLSLFFFLIF